MGMHLYDDLVCIPFKPEIYIEMGLVYKGKLSGQKKEFINYIKNNYNSIKIKENLKDYA